MLDDQFWIKNTTPPHPKGNEWSVITPDGIVPQPNAGYFRIDNLQLDNYILKVIPIGPKLYKYNASVTQLNLESDKDPILSKLNEKQLNITLYKIEYKTIAKSRYI